MLDEIVRTHSSQIVVVRMPRLLKIGSQNGLFILCPVKVVRDGQRNSATYLKDASGDIITVQGIRSAQVCPVWASGEVAARPQRYRSIHGALEGEPSFKFLWGGEAK